MTLLINQLDSDILYPDSDGTPMAESDPARDYLIYCVESLSIYFQDRQDVYVSGNLFIYYGQGVPDAVVAPDVFVVFGVEKKKGGGLSFRSEVLNLDSHSAPEFQTFRAPCSCLPLKSADVRLNNQGRIPACCHRSCLA